MLSKRDRIRDAAEEVLRQARQPMHNSEIASRVLPQLNLEGVSPKDVNTCLHDDPKHRFQRVAKGTWTLNRP